MAKVTTDITTLAEQLRDDLETCGDKTPLWSSLCADVIEIHHIPPGADDGPMDGTLMPDLVGWEHSAFRKAMPDWGYSEVKAGVDGDTIHLNYTLGGTLADGTHATTPAEMHIQVRDGRITRLEGGAGEGMGKITQELAASGGFEMPTELIARAREARTKTS